MIDLKLLDQGEIEAGVHGLGTQVRRKCTMRRHPVARQLRHLVIRSRKFILDTDRKNGKIVQEERIAVIGIEYQDQVRKQPGEFFLRSCKQSSGVAVVSALFEHGRKGRIVVDAY